MWTTAPERRQADAAAAGALLVDDDVEGDVEGEVDAEVEDEDEDDPESGFFDDESDEDGLLASPEPLDVDESADTFSLAGPSDAPTRLSVR